MANAWAMSNRFVGVGAPLYPGLGYTPYGPGLGYVAPAPVVTKKLWSESWYKIYIFIYIHLLLKLKILLIHF